MKKKILNALAGVMLSTLCLAPLANVESEAKCSCSSHSFSHYEYYDVEHPGYYTKEAVVSYIKNPDNAVYDAYGNFLYWEMVPDTEVVDYVDVWNPGWTEHKCRKVTTTYVENPDNAVYDAYGNFLYWEEVPDTELVSYEEIY